MYCKCSCTSVFIRPTQLLLRFLSACLSQGRKLFQAKVFEDEKVSRQEEMALLLVFFHSSQSFFLSFFFFFKPDTEISPFSLAARVIKNSDHCIFCIHSIFIFSSIFSSGHFFFFILSSVTSFIKNKCFHVMFLSENLLNFFFISVL